MTCVYVLYVFCAVLDSTLVLFQNLYSRLPVNNRKICTVVLKLLSKVARRSRTNLMDADNLARIFYPFFFPDMASLRGESSSGKSSSIETLNSENSETVEKFYDWIVFLIANEAEIFDNRDRANPVADLQCVQNYREKSFFVDVYTFLG